MKADIGRRDLEPDQDGEKKAAGESSGDAAMKPENKNGLHRCKPFFGEFVVAQPRIELGTRGFSIRCSTN